MILSALACFGIFALLMLFIAILTVTYIPTSEEILEGVVEAAFPEPKVIQPSVLSGKYECICELNPHSVTCQHYN